MWMTCSWKILARGDQDTNWTIWLTIWRTPTASSQSSTIAFPLRSWRWALFNWIGLWWKWIYASTGGYTLCSEHPCWEKQQVVQGCHICSGWSSSSGCFDCVLIRFRFDLEIAHQVYLLDFGLVATVPNTPEHLKHILPQFCSCMPAQVWMIPKGQQVCFCHDQNGLLLIDWMLPCSDQLLCIRPSEQPWVPDWPLHLTASYGLRRALSASYKWPGQLAICKFWSHF